MKSTLFLADILDRANIVAPQASFVEVQSFSIQDTCLTTIFQHPNSTVTFPEIVLGAGAVLQTRFGIKPSAWGKILAPVTFRIHLFMAGGDSHILFEKEVDARRSADQLWHECEVSLGAWERQQVRISLETFVVGGRTGMAWAGWGQPEIAGAALVTRPIRSQAQRKLPTLPGQAPLVLLVTCDALRRDHLSCYGPSPVSTPNLDALAAQSVLLDNVRTNSSTTLGTYTTLLSGLPAEITGVSAEWGEFPTHHVSLPQLFAQAGYRTVFAPSERELSDASSRISTLFQEHVATLGNPAQQSSLTARRLIRHLQEHPPTAETPVFAWLQLFEPHPPSLPEAKFLRDLYTGDPRAEVNRDRSHLVPRVHGVETSHSFSLFWKEAKGEMPGIIFDRLRAVAEELAQGGVGGPDLARHLVSMGAEAMLNMEPKDFGHWLLGELAFTHERMGDVSPALLNWLADLRERLDQINHDLLEHMRGVVDWRYAEALYAASVASVDHAMGLLLSEIKALGLFDEAVILFTSPHGEGISERDQGLMNHHYLGEEVLRTPGILKLPQSSHAEASGMRSQVSLQTTEIAATLLAAASCPMVEFFSAKHQRLPALLQGVQEPNRQIVSTDMQLFQACLVEGRNKLLRKSNPWPRDAGAPSILELWELGADGKERLVSEPDELLMARLAADLERTLPVAALDWFGRWTPPVRQLPNQGSLDQGNAPEGESANAQQEKIRKLEIQVKSLTKSQDQLHKQLAQGIRYFRELASSAQQMMQSRRWKVANVFRKDKTYRPLEKSTAKTNGWLLANQSSENRLILGSEQYPQWLLRRRPTAAEAAARLREINGAAPTFGIFICLQRTTRLALFEKTLQSLINQIYPHWVAWIVLEDGVSPPSIPNSSNLNFLTEWPDATVAPSSQCTHWCSVGAEDELEPQALLGLATATQAHQEANFFHTDEDEISEGGKVSNPLLKPAWSPDLLDSMPYTGALVAVETSFFLGLGVSWEMLDVRNAYDLALRCSGQPAFRLQRVTSPVYHRRTQPTPLRRNQAVRDLHALRQALERRRELAQACLQSDGRTFRVQRLIQGRPKVTIIIPSRDQAVLLDRCLRSMKSLTAYPNYEVVILDNESTQPAARELLNRCGHRVIPVAGPFNYAAMNNLGVRSTEGDMILLLNNDTEVLEPNWLGAMVEHAQRPEVGTVGAKLLFPDNTVQHAGVVLGIQGRAAHAFAGADPSSSKARRQLHATRNFSAVTAACVLMRREVYERLQGFDEERFKIAYNDVDLGVRATRMGLRNVYTPHAVLRHHECASRPRVDNPHEVSLLQASCFGREAGWTDPFYHPLLNQNSPNFEIDYAATEPTQVQ